MRVLFTAWYNSPNTYLKDIADSLMEEGCEVLCSKDVFWHTNVSFDIIHIQWPEQLFTDRSFNRENLDILKKRIYFLKEQGVRFVATLHNELPHQSNELNKELYQFVYENVDVIIHLGYYSTRAYPHKKNTVVFHPNYNRHIQIRKVIEEGLSLSQNRFLCFGNIRNRDEEQQIIDGFLKAEIFGAELIILNSLIGINPYGRRDLFRRFFYKRFLRKLNKRNIQLIPGKVSSDDINQYFNWTDYVISPRVNNLNSGVVFLGFSFGKIVIGPRIGNIGEFLEQHNNPTFEPLNVESISNAFKEAQEMEGVGQKNKEFSDKSLSPEEIARQHMDVYKELLG